MYDVEFQVHAIGVWFRVNDVQADNEEEVISLAKVKLKNNAGIEIDLCGHSYDVEIVNFMEVD